MPCMYFQALGSSDCTELHHILSRLQNHTNRGRTITKVQRGDQPMSIECYTCTLTVFFRGRNVDFGCSRKKCRGKKNKKREILLGGLQISHISTKAPPLQLLNEIVEMMLQTLLFSLQQNCAETEVHSHQTLVRCYRALAS